MQLDWSKVPYICDAKMRILRQQIFPVDTEPDANTRIKLAKLIEFGLFLLRRSRLHSQLLTSW